MTSKSEFELAFNEITEMRSLPRLVVLEALQNALISAYRRDAGVGNAQKVEVIFDETNGRARIFVEKEVVEGAVESPHTEVDLEKARYFVPECNVGDVIMVQVEGTTKKLGRIAAQTAKQVILQKIREAERKALYEEFRDREGDLVSGTVQNITPTHMIVSLGRVEAKLPRTQQITTEHYKQHDKIRAYVLQVADNNKGPEIIISRSHRNMLRRLLEYEVPEIYNGQVEIKNIAREAGYRSKVAVVAAQEGIDPVGACVGQRGTRIQNIVKELHDEKIDVIEWNANQEIFITKALSPAEVTGVYLEDDPDNGRTATVIVPDEKLSLAIGREGQNARLAAKLTAWRIDIKSLSEAVLDGLKMLDLPELTDLATKHSDLVDDVRRIMDKKAAAKTVMAEEYTTLKRFADMVEKRMLGKRNAARQARVAEINAVRATLPQIAFDAPINKLHLPDEVIEALQPLENVGEIMLRFLIDESRLRRLLSNMPVDTLQKVQEALDAFISPETAAPVAEEEETAVDVAPAAAAAVESEEVLDAFADEPSDEKPAPRKPAVAVAAPVRKDFVAPAIDGEVEEVSEDDDDDGDGFGKGKKEKTTKKKERHQRRQLIFDEEIGRVIAKRRRKGGRGGEWEEEE